MLLVEALDTLVESGAMPPARRPGAEVPAWAAVHGMSVLVLDGPLSAFSGAQIDAMVEHALSVTIAGLTAP